MKLPKLNLNLRKLWDETIKYDISSRNTDERESIEHCRDSDYKYFIHYVAGQNYTFNQFINRDNAVSNKKYINKKNIATTYKYFDRNGRRK